MDEDEKDDDEDDDDDVGADGASSEGFARGMAFWEAREDGVGDGKRGEFLGDNNNK